MIVARGPGPLVEEAGVHECDLGEVPRRAVGEERRKRAADVEVLGAPERGGLVSTPAV